MTYKDYINHILYTAKGFPEVHTAFYGNVYDLADRSDVEFSAVVVTPAGGNGDVSGEGVSTYTVNIFYVDRQTADGKNILDVQSHAIDVLNTIVDNLDFGLTASDYEVRVFEERFGSLCAGAYMELEVQTDMTFCDTYRPYETTTTTTEEPVPPTPEHFYVDYGTENGLSFDNKWSAKKWGDADRLESIAHGVYPNFFRLGFSSNPQTVPMAAAVDDPFNPNLKYLAIGRPVNTTTYDFETCATPSTISYYAFQNVSGLEAIYIGESVKTVDYRAFTCSPSLDDDERFDHINRIVLFGSHAPALIDSRGQGRRKLSGLAQEGVLEYKNDVMSNLEAWINAIPSGWEVKKT